MRKSMAVILSTFFLITSNYPQGFNLPSNGVHVFQLKDPDGRNQAIFFSEARFENITGITNDVWGTVSLDLRDIKNSLSGEVMVSVSSLKTGIEKRDEHLKSISWLDAKDFPFIKFTIKEVKSVSSIENDVVKITFLGEFYMRGKKNLVYANATIKYLTENDLTKDIMAGNLLSVVANFEIKLSDFGITNPMIGNRVSDKISITATLVGSDSQ